MKYLSSPSMEVTTMIGCPLMCTYCPQEPLRKNYPETSTKYMQLDDYKVMLAKIPGHVSIAFCGMSEPWANPICDDLLEHTLSKGYRVSICTTLYGMSNPRRTSHLLNKYNSQIQALRLHLPDRSGNMKGWRESESWREAYINISSLTLNCGIERMTMDKDGVTNEKIHDLFQKTDSFRGHQRAGALDLKKLNGQPVLPLVKRAGPILCSMSPNYDANMLLPNGDVLLCCHDYNMRHILGNLLQLEKYEDLFKSDELKNVRLINESDGFSTTTICKSCHEAVGFDQEHMYKRAGVEEVLNRVFNKYRPENIAFWGAGAYLSLLYDSLDMYNYKPLLIFDKTRKIEKFEGVPVLQPPAAYEMQNLDVKCIVITALSSGNDIERELRENYSDIEIFRLHKNSIALDKIV